MKMYSRYAAAAIASALLVTACQKAINNKPANAAISATTQSDATTFAGTQSLLNSHDAFAFGLATGAISNADIVASGSCPPVTTYDPSPDVYPHTKTVDWGEGCTSNGLTRSGKVIFYYTGDMAVVGSTVTTSYDNYFENGVKFEGQQLMVYNKVSPLTTAPVYILQQQDRKVIQPNGDYTIFGGTRRIAQWSDSSGHPGFPHGWFRVSGTITGNELKGTEQYQYTETLSNTDPIIYRNCEFITGGQLHIEFSNGQSPWDINYGFPKVCDDQALLTIDGVTTTITLPFTP